MHTTAGGMKSEEAMVAGRAADRKGATMAGGAVEKAAGWVAGVDLVVTMVAVMVMRDRWRWAWWQAGRGRRRSMNLVADLN